VNEVMKTSGSRLRTVATWSGYGLFFVAALIVSLLLTFPNRQLKSYVEARARTAGYPVRIGEMRLTGLVGVHLSDVNLTVPAKKKKKAARPGQPAPKAAEPMVLHFDELHVDVALLPAIDGKLDVRFEFEVGDGHLEGGRARVAGKKVDVEIDEIDQLSLEQMGVSRHVLAFQNKLTGDLDGLLSGKAKVHWGGTHEDFSGKIDLELGDAVMRSPRLEVQGGLAMADLHMGVLSATVNIDQMGKIAILKGKAARNKATAISLEGVDIFGPDIELVLEERSHISIPPGKSGFRGARMQIHFAFALPQPKAPEGKPDKDGETGEEEEKEDASLLKWSDLMKFAGSKLKPFQRAGYVGMTCNGALSRAKCLPALPQVTVGTRRKARSDARARKKQADDKPDADEEDKAKKKKAEDEAKKKAEAEAKKKAEEAIKKKAEEDAKKKAEEEAKKKAAEKVELKTVKDRADKAPVERGGDEEGRGDERRGPEPDEEGERGDEGDDDRGEDDDEAAEDDEEDEENRGRKRGADPEAEEEEEAEGDRDEKRRPKAGADEEEGDEEAPIRGRGRLRPR